MINQRENIPPLETGRKGTWFNDFNKVRNSCLLPKHSRIANQLTLAGGYGNIRSPSAF